MHLRVLKQVAAPSGVMLRVGQIVDLPPEEAGRYLKNGDAEEVVEARLDEGAAPAGGGAAEEKEAD